MVLSSWIRSVRSLFDSDGLRPQRRSAGTRLSVAQLEDRTVPSTFTVKTLNDAGPDSLRAAIVSANSLPGADVIRFSGDARHGTIALTSGELNITDDLWIDGPGSGRLAVSGSNASRIFNIGAGTDVSIDDLTITKGSAMLTGGGILNAGDLSLSGVVVTDNRVLGLPGVGMAVDAFGGGVFNSGNLSVRNSIFSGNRSQGGDGVPGGPGSAGLGGAIASLGSPIKQASVTISRTSFVDNLAVGGAAGAGATFTRNGLGGALMNDAGTLTVDQSLFQGNQAIGGFGGGAVSFGSGGAIQNAALIGNATLQVTDSSFLSNSAIGGATGTGIGTQSGIGGAITNFIPGFAALPVTVAATATIEGSTFLGNRAIGGTGPVGGAGRGGALANLNAGSMTVISSLIALNSAIGGAGTAGNGGVGQGGGIFNGGPIPIGAPTLSIESSLIVFNEADGGVSTGGVEGLGFGGGVYVMPGGTASAVAWTFVFANSADTDNNVFGELM